MKHICPNNMVVSWILNSVSLKILASVVYRDTTLEVWKDVKERFSQGNGPRIFLLQKYLAGINQGELSITDHFTWLKFLWDEIDNYKAFTCCTCGRCTCGINQKLIQHQLQDSVIQFLMGLNDNYNQIWSQILLMEPLPSINKAYSLLMDLFPPFIKLTPC